ncbi:MAG TPA: hypothetical protein HA346_05210 [Thermoplasmata archaeon]|nr:hypothetical protein [Thermoplasmata archaeon]
MTRHRTPEASLFVDCALLASDANPTRWLVWSFYVYSNRYNKISASSNNYIKTNILHLIKKPQVIINDHLKCWNVIPNKEKAEVMLTTGFSTSSVFVIKKQNKAACYRGENPPFLLAGGCDFPLKKTEYFRELVQKLPEDTIVLLLACGKFRINDLKLGNIEGVPRLIDLGQCNDSIVAIEIAQTLSELFGVSINELPLTLVLSWMEQKTVAIIWNLSTLGISGIYPGSILSALVNDDILKVLRAN